jgi:hypothetical protein
MIRKSLIGSLIGIAAFVPAVEGALKIDINDIAALTQTQAGFTVADKTNGALNVVSDIGTVNISFSPVVGITIDDRDRGAMNPAQPLAALLRDFIFINGTLPAQGTIATTISGINSGTYLFTGYFHDSSVNHGSGDLQISVDGGGTFPNEFQDALYSTGTNPVEVGRASLPFTATSGIDVVVRVLGDGGNPGNPAATTETAVFSGFVIESFTTLGDFNLSGMVEVNDFYVLSDNLGAHLDGNYVGHAGGDINLDGRVDLNDFGQFKALFPAVAAAAALGVPEPTTTSLALLMVLGGSLARCRRRPHR